MDRQTAQRIAEGLTMPWSRVELIADGHRVSAAVVRATQPQIRYVIMVYVDGWFRGENLKADSEIGNKFYPLRTRLGVSAKSLVEYRKACGKRAAEDLKKRMTYQFREATFNTGRAFAAHLRKHCTNVEIVESIDAAATQ